MTNMPLLELAYALAVGLIIGLERGWSQRGRGEGQRFAGMRTFAIASLLGGVVTLVSERVGGNYALLVWLAVFVAVAALAVVAHVIEARHDADFGITTPLSLLLTFVLGSLCLLDLVDVAVSVAVIAALLLGLKPVLHGWLERLQQRELLAILQMLVISVVMLPVLPNQGYGPGEVLNPYLIGWMVVLITGISFVGYFAIKLLGSHRGLMLTGLLGGLASSTAVTLTMAQLGKVQQHGHKLFVAATLLAAGTMFPRMLVEIAVVNQTLLQSLAAALLTMTGVTYLGVAWLVFGKQEQAAASEISVANPFDIITALKFAALLVVILLVAHYAHQYFDALGVYAVAAISGLSDVDAITLSLAKLSSNGLAIEVASQAILLAATVNTIVKVGLIISLGHPAMRAPMVLIALVALIAGWSVWWLG